MAASIKDVAKKAGVSVGTVSRALNNYTDVSEKTRDRIKDVAKQLEYRPNVSAKNLSSKNNKNIAMIVSGLKEEQQTDDMTMSLLKGAYLYTAKRKMTIATYATSSSEQEEKSFDEFCREYSLSGALLLGLKTTDKYIRNLCEAQIPCVTVDTEIKGGHIGNIITDDVKAFEEITEYLIKRNHKELILVYGRKEAMVSQKRFEGFENALHKHHMKSSEIPILYADFLEKTAYKKTKELLHKKGKASGTAFVCMSDLMAFGVARAVRDCGYRIPEDFSVTGFDGISFGQYVEPSITTVDQDMRKKGYEGARLLIKMVKGEETPNKVVVPHTIIERSSVRTI